MPTPEQKVCPECGGSGDGEVHGGFFYADCPTCKGTGRVVCPACGSSRPHHSRNEWGGMTSPPYACPDPFHSVNTAWQRVHTGLEDQGAETSDGRDRQVRGAGSDNREGLARRNVSASGKRGDDITGPPSEELSEDQGGEGEAEGSGLRSASSGWHISLPGDERYAEIIDLSKNEGATLLRVGGQAGPPGHGDVQRVRDFIAWVRATTATPAEASGVGAEKSEVERLRAERDEARDEAVARQLEWLRTASKLADTEDRAEALATRLSAVEGLRDELRAESSLWSEPTREAIRNISDKLDALLQDPGEGEGA